MNSNVLENESEKLDNLKSELDCDITPCHEEQQHSMYSLCEAFFFCILCFCIILFDTRFWNKVSFCRVSVHVSSIIICCLGAMKIEGSMEEMISNLFQNCDEYFEDVNENGDPELIDLATTDFILFTVIVREKNRRCRRRLREASQSRKFRRLTQEYIWKKIPKSSKMHYYTRAHMLHDVNTFRERMHTCKYRSKSKSCNGRERSKNPPIRESFKYKWKAGETNRRVEVRLPGWNDVQTDQMFSEIVIIG